MRGSYGHSRHQVATRYGVLGLVVLAHLALGWWLLRGVAPLQQPLRQLALAPVLIQDVVLEVPEPASVPAPVPQPKAAVLEPAAQRPARVAAVARPAPAATREIPPDRTQKVPASQPVNTSMASPVLPAAAPASSPASGAAPTASPASTSPTAATVGQPADAAVASPLAAPAAASASGSVRSGSGASAPTPPQAAQSGPTRNASGTGTGAVSGDIALVCPTQVVPVTPRFAQRAGITGEVEARIVVVDGRVRDVQILSGPTMFHQAVRDAIRQYRCVPHRTEVQATQKFTFRFE